MANRNAGEKKGRGASNLRIASFAGDSERQFQYGRFCYGIENEIRCASIRLEPRGNCVYFEQNRNQRSGPEPESETEAGLKLKEETTSGS
ncbi:hypothetical protein EVAR_46862_1 [Eumeta japonica]|uniref:Uncharacterized protein n=1 Tax=Eumeta variegata TaxID=151549 RepID=A0A4C1XNK9_EUMVA|nr:hypothetical protein EVAR_46862_1 [Eumeta japonica]